MNKLTLRVLPVKLGICRLDKGVLPPGWITASKDFYSITGTADETSLVCREDLIPAGYLAEKGFCLLQVVGPLDFALTGILASLLNPLAEAGISVFTLSTYDTDYILVKKEDLDRAVALLGTICLIEQ